MFYLYEGNTRDLPTDKNHLNFRWSEADILFSMTRKGNAALIHFTAHGKAVRRLKKAINEFCQRIFDSCKWCEMIIGQIQKDSVVRLALKLGFIKIAEKNNIKIMMRERECHS